MANIGVTDPTGAGRKKKKVRSASARPMRYDAFNHLLILALSARNYLSKEVK